MIFLFLGIMILCSWGRLFPFVLGGDYVSLFLGIMIFFVPRGDYDFLVGIVWGLCPSPIYSSVYPQKLSMGEVDPSSSVCFFLQLSLGTVA